MDNRFTPFGGPGFGRPFFRPFPHPFFPRRFLFPFFFFSPFFFPFFRDGAEQSDICFAQHQVQAGDTMARIAHMYNMPLLILEEANHQIANPNELRIGEIVYIPRISNMHCQKTYEERDTSNTGTPMPMAQGQQPMMSYAGMPNNMPPGLTMPNKGF